MDPSTEHSDSSPSPTDEDRTKTKTKKSKRSEDGEDTSEQMDTISHDSHVAPKEPSSRGTKKSKRELDEKSKKSSEQSKKKSIKDSDDTGTRKSSEYATPEDECEPIDNTNHLKGVIDVRPIEEDERLDDETAEDEQEMESEKAFSEFELIGDGNKSVQVQRRSTSPILKKRSSSKNLKSSGPFSQKDSKDDDTDGDKIEPVSKSEKSFSEFEVKEDANKSAQLHKRSNSPILKKRLSNKSEKTSDPFLQQIHEDKTETAIQSPVSSPMGSVKKILSSRRSSEKSKNSSTKSEEHFSRKSSCKSNKSDFEESQRKTPKEEEIANNRRSENISSTKLSRSSKPTLYESSENKMNRKVREISVNEIDVHIPAVRSSKKNGKHSSANHESEHSLNSCRKSKQSPGDIPHEPSERSSFRTSREKEMVQEPSVKSSKKSSEDVELERSPSHRNSKRSRGEEVYIPETTPKTSKRPNKENSEDFYEYEHDLSIKSSRRSSGQPSYEVVQAPSIRSSIKSNRQSSDDVVLDGVLQESSIKSSRKSSRQPSEDIVPGSTVRSSEITDRIPSDCGEPLPTTRTIRKTECESDRSDPCESTKYVTVCVSDKRSACETRNIQKISKRLECCESVCSGRKIRESESKPSETMSKRDTEDSEPSISSNRKNTGDYESSRSQRMSKLSHDNNEPISSERFSKGSKYSRIEATSQRSSKRQVDIQSLNNIEFERKEGAEFTDFDYGDKPCIDIRMSHNHFKCSFECEEEENRKSSLKQSYVFGQEVKDGKLEAGDKESESECSKKYSSDDSLNVDRRASKQDEERKLEKRQKSMTGDPNLECGECESKAKKLLCQLCEDAISSCICKDGCLLNHDSKESDQKHRCSHECWKLSSSVKNPPPKTHQEYNRLTKISQSEVAPPLNIKDSACRDHEWDKIERTRMSSLNSPRSRYVTTESVSGRLNQNLVSEVRERRTHSSYLSQPPEVITYMHSRECPSNVGPLRLYQNDVCSPQRSRFLETIGKNPNDYHVPSWQGDVHLRHSPISMSPLYSPQRYHKSSGIKSHRHMRIPETHINDGQSIISIESSTSPRYKGRSTSLTRYTGHTRKRNMNHCFGWESKSESLTKCQSRPSDCSKHDSNGSDDTDSTSCSEYLNEPNVVYSRLTLESVSLDRSMTLKKIKNIKKKICDELESGDDGSSSDDTLQCSDKTSDSSYDSESSTSEETACNHTSCSDCHEGGDNATGNVKYKSKFLRHKLESCNDNSGVPYKNLKFKLNYSNKDTVDSSYDEMITSDSLNGGIKNKTSNRRKHTDSDSDNERSVNQSKHGVNKQMHFQRTQTVGRTKESRSLKRTQVKQGEKIDKSNFMIQEQQQIDCFEQVITPEHAVSICNTENDNGYFKDNGDSAKKRKYVNPAIIFSKQMESSIRRHEVQADFDHMRTFQEYVFSDEIQRPLKSKVLSKSNMPSPMNSIFDSTDIDSYYQTTICRKDKNVSANTDYNQTSSDSQNKPSRIAFTTKSNFLHKLNIIMQPGNNHSFWSKNQIARSNSVTSINSFNNSLTSKEFVTDSLKIDTFQNILETMKGLRMCEFQFMPDILSNQRSGEIGLKDSLIQEDKRDDSKTGRDCAMIVCCNNNQTSSDSQEDHSKASHRYINDLQHTFANILSWSGKENLNSNSQSRKKRSSSLNDSFNLQSYLKDSSSSKHDSTISTKLIDNMKRKSEIVLAMAESMSQNKNSGTQKSRRNAVSNNIGDLFAPKEDLYREKTSTVSKSDHNNITEKGIQCELSKSTSHRDKDRNSLQKNPCEVIYYNPKTDKSSLTIEPSQQTEEPPLISKLLFDSKISDSHQKDTNNPLKKNPSPFTSGLDNILLFHAESGLKGQMQEPNCILSGYSKSIPYHQQVLKQNSILSKDYTMEDSLSSAGFSVEKGVYYLGLAQDYKTKTPSCESLSCNQAKSKNNTCDATKYAASECNAYKVHNAMSAKLIKSFSNVDVKRDIDDVPLFYEPSETSLFSYETSSNATSIDQIYNPNQQPSDPESQHVFNVANDTENVDTSKNTGRPVPKLVRANYLFREDALVKWVKRKLRKEIAKLLSKLKTSRSQNTAFGGKSNDNSEALLAVANHSSNSGDFNTNEERVRREIQNVMKLFQNTRLKTIGKRRRNKFGSKYKVYNHGLAEVTVKALKLNSQINKRLAVDLFSEAKDGKTMSEVDNSVFSNKLNSILDKQLVTNMCSESADSKSDVDSVFSKKRNNQINKRLAMNMFGESICSKPMGGNKSNLFLKESNENVYSGRFIEADRQNNTSFNHDDCGDFNDIGRLLINNGEIVLSDSDERYKQFVNHNNTEHPNKYLSTCASYSTWNDLQRKMNKSTADPKPVTDMVTSPMIPKELKNKQLKEMKIRKDLDHELSCMESLFQTIIQSHVPPTKESTKIKNDIRSNKDVSKSSSTFWQSNTFKSSFMKNEPISTSWNHDAAPIKEAIDPAEAFVKAYLTMGSMTRNKPNRHLTRHYTNKHSKLDPFSSNNLNSCVGSMGDVKNYYSLKTSPKILERTSEHLDRKRNQFYAPSMVANNDNFLTNRSTLKGSDESKFINRYADPIISPFERSRLKLYTSPLRDWNQNSNNGLDNISPRRSASNSYSRDNLLMECTLPLQSGAACSNITSSKAILDLPSLSKSELKKKVKRFSLRSTYNGKSGRKRHDDPLSEPAYQGAHFDNIDFQFSDHARRNLNSSGNIFHKLSTDNEGRYDDNILDESDEDYHSAEESMTPYVNMDPRGLSCMCSHCTDLCNHRQLSLVDDCSRKHIGGMRNNCNCILKHYQNVKGEILQNSKISKKLECLSDACEVKCFSNNRSEQEDRNYDFPFYTSFSDRSRGEHKIFKITGGGTKKSKLNNIKEFVNWYVNGDEIHSKNSKGFGDKNCFSETGTVNKNDKRDYELSLQDLHHTTRTDPIAAGDVLGHKEEKFNLPCETVIEQEEVLESSSESSLGDCNERERVCNGVENISYHMLKGLSDKLENGERGNRYFRECKKNATLQDKNQNLKLPQKRQNISKLKRGRLIRKHQRESPVVKNEAISRKEQMGESPPEEVSESMSLEDIEVPQVEKERVRFACDKNGEWAEVGRGSYGCVYLGLLDGEIEVAIKDFYESNSYDHVIHEARMLLFLQNTGIIPMFYGLRRRFDATTEPGEYCIIMEYFGDGKTLFNVLSDKVELSTVEWIDVVGQLVAGLRLIHRKKVLINDLKADNILIDLNGARKTIRYIDVGMATYKQGLTFQLPQNQMGKYNFLAPEVRAGFHTSKKSDIYSLGYMLEQIFRVAGTALTGLESLVGHCMREDPKKRPSADDIVTRVHKFIEASPIVKRSAGKKSTKAPNSV